MRIGKRRILFGLFFISGLCGLIYQVVWTRLAFAAFGIITPVLSVVLSVFMLGLSVGAWLGGRYIGAMTRRTGFSAILFYGFSEFTIGLGAFLVPVLFRAGQRLLLGTGQSNSFAYLLLSGLVLTLSILPWCVLMGATFPLVMEFVREEGVEDAGSFSFLYLANVLGAMGGALFSALVLVEVFGFQQTLRIAAIGNFLIAAVALRLGRRIPAGALNRAAPETASRPKNAAFTSPEVSGGPVKWMLFATGFSAMAMEVVWSRQFTPVLKTQVYSFAMIVFTYLGATFFGSWVYRRHFRQAKVVQPPVLIALLAVVVFLPAILCDPRWILMSPEYGMSPAGAVIVLASIVPVCGVLGYLTPSLVDAYSGGRPDRAGNAYSINVFGCILGPLFACYGLLPWLNERWALIILSLPFLAFGFLGRNSLAPAWRAAAAAAAGVLALYSLFFAKDYQELVTRASRRIEVRRDYAASVISADNGIKMLLVNGIGMTSLTPITKFMVHLPLAIRREPPRSVLVICFGMGTTYRSALSWNVETTAVELVPSVTRAFGFYHPDAGQVLANPKGHVVIDDGRRFLARTRESFDVIVVDPPPPVEAAGSSLLYSTQFYELAKRHLNPHGILQAWFPGGEKLTAQAVVSSVCASFPYVRCFFSVEGWGIHILASMDPIEVAPAAQLAERMPAGARRDLLEWAPSRDLPGYLRKVVTNEVSVADILNPDPHIQITDDDPVNE